MTSYITVRDNGEGLRLFRRSSVILISKKEGVAEYDTPCSRELRCRTLFKKESHYDPTFYVYLTSKEIQSLKDHNEDIFPSTIFVYGAHNRFDVCCQIRVCVNMEEVVGLEKDEKVVLMEKGMDEVIAECNIFSGIKESDNDNKYNKEESLNSLKSEGKLFRLEPISTNPFVKNEHKIHETEVV